MEMKQGEIERLARINPSLANIDPHRIPRHVAVIMDGNGRWAKSRGLDRSEGHVAGVRSVHRITEAASDLGVDFLTLYAFSTENWNRPDSEVAALMHLIGIAIQQELAGLIENNVRLRLIGDISRVPADAAKRLFDAVDATAHCTGLTLLMCISYSSRWEIARAASHLAQKAADGEISPADIDESMFASALAAPDVPDPDLLIRTGGDFRISNYLLWQIAYSELFFTTTLWPDFDKPDFAAALLDFQQRERRFGKTSEQVASDNIV